jgi:transcriptional regulator with XRE-family HTH domain
MSRKKVSHPVGKSRKDEISKRIRALRGFEMTQKEFGEKLGISQSMVSRLEKGEIPSIELLLRISEVFEKPTDWILKGEE